MRDVVIMFYYVVIILACNGNLYFYLVVWKFWFHLFGIITLFRKIYSQIQFRPI